MAQYGILRGAGRIVKDDSRASSKNLVIALMRSTPSRFSIEHFVSTGKSTGDCHHGMHISSDSRGKCTSISSIKSLPEYDIWRSWEDCLFFQHTLEEAYERAAREKRKRLAQGKGVKGFDGVYKKDLASSWDSLPSGPDHRSVAQDIHEYLPTLTKRGTIFRASQLTIDRRQAELIAFIRALFSDDMPALIKEIRVTSLVSDFFGLWRSDYDIDQEFRILAKKSSSNNQLSSIFSSSRLSLASSHSTSSSRSTRSTTQSRTSLNSLETPSYPCGSSRSSRFSTSSDSSYLSESSSDTSSLSGLAIADNVDPIVFGHSSIDQFNPILEVLPEEQETLPKSPEPYREVKPEPGASATESKAPRSNPFFGLLLRKSLLSSERLGNRSVRESWQTTYSQDSAANDVLDGLGLVLPHPIKEQKFRASIASVLTSMTTDSADAVIPQTPLGSSQISTSLSLSGADGKHSVPDAFPCPVSSISESLEALEVDLPLPASPSSTSAAFNCPPSPTYTSTSSSAFTTTSSLIPADSICIKAIHGTSIILLRVPRRIGFEEVKQRLYDKFTNKEGISLSQTFNVVFVSPSAQPVTSPIQTEVQAISLDSDWGQLMSTFQGNKITLRIQDN